MLKINNKGIWHSAVSFFVPFAVQYFNPAYFADGKVCIFVIFSNKKFA